MHLSTTQYKNDTDKLITMINCNQSHVQTLRETKAAPFVHLNETLECQRRRMQPKSLTRLKATSSGKVLPWPIKFVKAYILFSFLFKVLRIKCQEMESETQGNFF